ncbi:YceD family protein [Phenylobacterium sp.]|uniref:YceD family protein n=1 Tax=Phenylobacterium sp. TaxID=1871053 RepID=UPI002FE2E37D
MSADWTRPLRLHELGRGAVTLTLEPDAAQRAKVAHDLGLESLPALTASLTVKPWLDGAEITGRFRAVVEQICSVSLDPFQQTLEGRIEVRAVPQGSPHAPAAEGGEVELDADAPDPPDVLDGDAVDLAGYVVEHLALEVDPFPRKPGAEFDYTPSTQEESPFAVLRKLKDPEG